MFWSKFGFNKRPSSFLSNSNNSLIWWLHNIIPLEIQHKFRDNGYLRQMFDVVVSIGAFVMCIVRPKLLFSHLSLSSNMLKLPYDCSVSKKSIEIVTLNDIGPVLMFIHGGAWGSGQTWMYRKIAVGMGYAMKAQAVAVVGYPVFPDATILEQSECIKKAIEVVRTHFSSHERYILAGHSSGAHISALALITSIESGCDLGIDAFIGLCGVYDLLKHYSFEAARGVHRISPMASAAKSPDRFAILSPTRRISGRFDFDEASLTSSSEILARTPDLSFPPSLLVHGLEDTTVPHTSTVEFAEALQRLGVPIRTYYPQSGHTDPIISLLSMEKDDCGHPLRRELRLFFEEEIGFRRNSSPFIEERSSSRRLLVETLH